MKQNVYLPKEAYFYPLLVKRVAITILQKPPRTTHVRAELKGTPPLRAAQDAR